MPLDGLQKQQNQQKLNCLRKQSPGPDLLLCLCTHLNIITPSTQCWKWDVWGISRNLSPFLTSHLQSQISISCQFLFRKHIRTLFFPLILCLRCSSFVTTGGPQCAPKPLGRLISTLILCIILNVLSKSPRWPLQTRIQFSKYFMQVILWSNPQLSPTWYLYALILSSKDSTFLQLSLRAKGRGVSRARGLVSRSSASTKNVRWEEMKDEAGDRQEPNYKEFCRPW